MKRSYEDVLSEYGNIAYDESSTLIIGDKQIINTPVKYEQKSASIFDSDGRQVGAYIHDDQGDELAKRINLHGSLVEALKYSVDFMEDRAATKYDLNKVSEFRKLLEQSK